MKRGDAVVIGCDGWSYVTKQAMAVRAVLEEMGLQAHLYPLHHKRAVSDFLSGEHVEAPYTLMICHGQGETDESATIDFRCTSAGSSHFTSPSARSMDGEHFSQPSVGPMNDREELKSSLALTPQNVKEHVRNGSGTLISVACGSGRPAFAQAFLDAGYEAYIGPENHESPVTGAYWFLSGFFHYLLAPSWSHGAQSYTDEEAAARASVNELTYRYFSVATSG